MICFFILFFESDEEIGWTNYNPKFQDDSRQAMQFHAIFKLLKRSMKLTNVNNLTHVLNSFLNWEGKLWHEKKWCSFIYDCSDALVVSFLIRNQSFGIERKYCQQRNLNFFIYLWNEKVYHFTCDSSNVMISPSRTPFISIVRLRNEPVHLKQKEWNCSAVFIIDVILHHIPIIHQIQGKCSRWVFLEKPWFCTEFERNIIWHI
jgi:hypothetical protein